MEKEIVVLLLSLINAVICFHQLRSMSNLRSTITKLRIGLPSTSSYHGADNYSPIFDNKRNAAESNNIIQNIRPSITDRARTIAHVCTTGTLCTTSSKKDIAGIPFGSYVDYILNEQGWPIVLLNVNAVHTQNIESNNKVSLFIQLPKLPYGQTMAAVSRVTMLGSIQKVCTDDSLNAIKFAFLLVHPHTEAIIGSNRFQFYEIKPLEIFFAGGFGVSSDWVSVPEYEHARPDIIANEVTSILSRINLEKQSELKLLCKHFLDIAVCDQIRIQSIDRLGIDLRVRKGTLFLSLLSSFLM
jgi:putative heme iron utilization protein